MHSISVSLPPYVLALMTRLEAEGEEVYLVGGSLRDSLLGVPAHDFDLATSALPEIMLRVFEGYRVITTGLKHGTLTVISEGSPVEITTFRIDGDYTDSRHPNEVTFTRRITEDLSRRDFTVNAMAYHPKVGLVDPFDGRGDLDRRLIRAVREPVLRFSEDALRIMRAFRFSAQLDFSIDEETVAGISDTKAGLSHIAVERIASEFLRLLTAPDPAPALRGMIDTGVLPYVTEDYCPSARILSLLSQCGRSEDERLGLFFSETTPEDTQRILRRLRLSNRQITGARAVSRGATETILTPADARRLIAEYGVYALSVANISTLLGHSPKEAASLVETNHAPCTLSELSVGGRELIAAGLPPRQVGKTLDFLLRQVIEDPTLNEPSVLLSLAEAYHKKTKERI